MLRPVLACCVLLCTVALLPGSAAADDSYFEQATPDASRIYFTTQEKLLAGDTDSEFDVYERASGVTRRITVGPAGGNGAVPASITGTTPDGTHVFFTTAEQMVAADIDSAVDVYDRSGGTTTLISTGPAGGNGAFNADYRGVSADGSVVVFISDEQLTANDTDTRVDVFAREAGVTTKATVGPAGGNGPKDGVFAGMSNDGSHIFVATYESLVAGDTDTAADVYDRSSGTTTQMSVGDINGNGNNDALPLEEAGDGSGVLFWSDEQLVAGDTDTSQDIYRRSGGNTTRVSAGQTNGNQSLPSFFDRATADLSVVYFQSAEQLDATDTDSAFDTFKRESGSTTRVTLGPAGGNLAFDAIPKGASTDGQAFFFITIESLVGGDTDGDYDVYQRLGSTTTRISTGPAGGNAPEIANFDATSADGSVVTFTTAEPLVAADTDAVDDTYQRSGSTTTLISGGTINGNGPHHVNFRKASSDGSRVVFWSDEQLVPGDTDGDYDVYERAGAITRLVSTAKSAPPAPVISAVAPGSPSSDNTPTLRGSAEAGSTVGIFDTPACSGATPLALGPAATFAGAGITVTVPSDATTNLYAAALDANGYSSPCSAASAYTEDSTAPGAPALSIGSSPSRDANPAVTGSAEGNTTVELFTGAGCSGTPAATGPSGSLGGGGIEVPVAQNATTQISGRAIDGAANVSPCSNALSYRHDSKPPQGKITKRPAKKVKTRKKQVKVTFKFKGSESSAKLRCRIDGRSYGKCSKSKSYTLKKGKHTFRLEATDAAGNKKVTTVSFKIVKL